MKKNPRRFRNGLRLRMLRAWLMTRFYFWSKGKRWEANRRTHEHVQKILGTKKKRTSAVMNFLLLEQKKVECGVLAFYRHEAAGNHDKGECVMNKLLTGSANMHRSPATIVRVCGWELPLLLESSFASRSFLIPRGSESIEGHIWARVGCVIHRCVIICYFYNLGASSEVHD